MSHVASVECFVTDLDALKSAADRLGFDLVQATTYKWYGTWVNDFRGGVAAVSNGHDPKNFGKCDGWKLRRKDHKDGMYEVGLVNRVDGQPGFELLYDNWSSGGRAIEERAGKNLETLKNELAAEVTMRIMARQGYRITRTVTPTGLQLDMVKG
jgi:hypothetical protein